MVPLDTSAQACRYAFSLVFQPNDIRYCLWDVVLEPYTCNEVWVHG